MFATRLRGWEGDHSGRGVPKGFRKKGKLLCIAAERIPYKEIGADWRGKMHPCSETELKQERQKGTEKQPEHLALSDTGRTSSEQCLSTTQLSRNLFLLKRHLQSSSTTPSHQTSLSNKPGSACISLLFHDTFSVPLCPHHIWQVSALQFLTPINSA